MLNSLKAISYGIITIFILGLCNQLLLIMGLVAYGSLTKTYPMLSEWSQIFTYALGGSGYFVVMLVGGFITTMAAVNKHYTATIIAAILGSSFSLYMSLKDEIFTPIALFFLLFGIFAAIMGCRFQLAYKAKKSVPLSAPLSAP